MSSADARIGRLIDRLEAAAASPENARRRGASPRIVFVTEDPICWTTIQDLEIERYFTDPFYYVERTLEQKLWRWERFPDDLMPLEPELPAWLGHYPEYTFVGIGVSFDSRGVPILAEDHPLRRDCDLGLLAGIDVRTAGWMPRVLRWYEDIRRVVRGRLPVRCAMTWWRGCLDLAVQLRGYEQLMADSVDRPGFLHGLLDRLVELRSRWWEAHAERMGEKIQPTAVADDWINVPFISPEFFRDFVLPAYLAIERFHGGITGVHSCGNQTPIQRYLLELRSLPVLEVSPWTDLRRTLENVPAGKELWVSLHPTEVLCGTPEGIEARLRGIIGACAARKYGIGTSGLTPLSADVARFEGQIRTWTAIARRLEEEVAARAVPTLTAAVARTSGAAPGPSSPAAAGPASPRRPANRRCIPRR